MNIFGVGLGLSVQELTSRSPTDLIFGPMDREIGLGFKGKRAERKCGAFYTCGGRSIPKGLSIKLPRTTKPAGAPTRTRKVADAVLATRVVCIAGPRTPVQHKEASANLRVELIVER